MPEAMPFQKVHFPWRSKSFKLQVGALYLLPMGGVEQDQGGERGVDLPNVNLGGRVWRNPWTFSWVFFYFRLGQLQHPKKVHRIFQVEILIANLFRIHEQI